MARECHESVMRQTVPCTHVMIADGNPRPEIDNWPVAHIVLPQGTRDTGGTPRAIGGLYAQGQRADAVAYLDGDNWYFDDHIARRIQCVRHGGAEVGVATMRVYTVEKEFSERHDDTVHPEYFVDTNRLFMTRAVFNCLDVWARIPPRLAVIYDRLFWLILTSHARKYCVSDQETVAYRTRHESFYNHRGLPLPENSKMNYDKIQESYKFWNDLDQEQRDIFFMRMGGHTTNMRDASWAKRYELRSGGGGEGRGAKPD
jgi:hypothetical protein